MGDHWDLLRPRGLPTPASGRLIVDVTFRWTPVEMPRNLGKLFHASFIACHLEQLSADTKLDLDRDSNERHHILHRVVGLYGVCAHSPKNMKPITMC